MLLTCSSSHLTQAMNMEEARLTPRDEDTQYREQRILCLEELTGQQRHESLIWRQSHVFRQCKDSNPLGLATAAKILGVWSLFMWGD